MLKFATLHGYESQICETKPIRIFLNELLSVDLITRFVILLIPVFVIFNSLKFNPFFELNFKLFLELRQKNVWVF